MTIDRTLGYWAAFFGATAVLAGAFGAHWLRNHVAADSLVTFETATRYQMYHALALLGLSVTRVPTSPSLRWAGWLFVAGTTIFSGTLYALVFTGQRWLGAVTPIGGLCLIGGWVFLGLGMARVSFSVESRTEG